MSKKVNQKNKNNIKIENNCVLHVVKQNGYINFSLDVDDIKNVKVRLLVPNVKLSAKLYHKVNDK